MAFGSAIQVYLLSENVPFQTVVTETTAIEDAGLIPDIAVVGPEGTLCLEPTWRAGDFLTSGHRSTIAAYVLTKLQGYARELGWIPDLAPQGGRT